MEAQRSVKLSSASYCASLVASLKPKSSIHNEPAQGTDKSSIKSAYSHRHLPARIKGMFETRHTYCGRGSLRLAARQTGQSCQETADNRETKQMPPTDRQKWKDHTNMEALTTMYTLKGTIPANSQTGIKDTIWYWTFSKDKSCFKLTWMISGISIYFGLLRVFNN